MSNKKICPKCAEENDREMFKNPYFNHQLLAKDKQIEALLEVIEDLENKLEKELEESRVDPCPHCQCSELLCGHPNNCTSED